jgi:hypothetical protein
VAVPSSIRTLYDQWQLDELLGKHPGLRIIPSDDAALILSGEIAFNGQGPRPEPIEDTYAIRLEVPPDFPDELPTVREIGGRISGSFHKLPDDQLCLGAPTALRLRLTESPTLVTYVDEFVVPYLFSHSFYLAHGEMPFGELAHGDVGLLAHLAELFGSEQSEKAQEFLHLASLRKRDANKHACPCQSGRRLGQCHNARVNELRDRLGRHWFAREYADVLRSLGNLATDHVPRATKSSRRLQSYEG